MDDHYTQTDFREHSTEREERQPDSKLDYADAPPGFHHCPKCDRLVSDERYELLGVEECVACTPQRPMPKGAWDYPEGFHERNEGVGGLIVLE